MEPLSHALAGAVGGVIAMALLYPLENVRTRLQVQIEHHKTNRLNHSPPTSSSSSLSPPSPPEHIEAESPPHYKGTFDCIVRVIQSEGWRSLYTGLTSALVGVGVSSAVYFFWYHLLRSHLLRLRNRSSLPALDNLLIASIAGVLNILCTLPIWVVNTRMTLANKRSSAQYSSIPQTFRTIVKEEGVAGLYKGLVPSLILVSNPAIQFLTYEQLIRILSSYYRRHSPTTSSLTLYTVTTVTANTPTRSEVSPVIVPALSSIDFFFLGAISKAVATVVTYPYQVVKCFARGTRVRLYNGDVVAVENVAPGMQLMGDDNSPRTVTQLARGRAPMYTIIPSEGGAKPFTVNGAHILVLINNANPTIKARDGRYSQPYAIEYWKVGTDNVMRTATLDTYMTEEEAQDVLEIEMRDWRPLVWEVSVDEFLSQAVTKNARKYSMMSFSNPVTFVNPQLPSLARALQTVLQAVPSQQQIDWMAWYLGMWLADGMASCAWVSQGGAPPPDPHHHQEIMNRLQQYQALFGEQVTQVFDRYSSAGHAAYWFKFGGGPSSYYTQSIAHRLLLSYGLINNKHVPQAWICDTLDVRRRIFAGLMDGDGHYQRESNLYVIAAKRLAVAEGYQVLAKSIGIRSNEIAQSSCTDPITDQVYTGWRQSFSGDMWNATAGICQFIACTYKRAPAPGTPQYRQPKKESHCFGFTITAGPVDDFFGFAVQGNNSRFLLEDFTITHNVSSHHTHATSTCTHHYHRRSLSLPRPLSLSLFKSRLQSEGGKGEGVWEMQGVVRRMMSEEGVGVFWNGMGAKMTQTVINSAFMFVVYEKIAEWIRQGLVRAVEVERKMKHIAALKQ